MNKIEVQNLVLGFFDGLHHGHELLFENLTNFGVLTFKNIPHKSTGFLYSLDQRIIQLKKLNPKIIYLFNVTRFNMPAQQFLKTVVKPLNPKRLVVGSDYHFGNDHQGVAKILQFFPNSIIVNRIPTSSSLLKQLINSGDFETANKILIEPYYRVGKVIKGNQQGALLGFPTANIEIDQSLINIKPGSYASVVTVANKNYFAVTFVGKSKTLSHQQSAIETYLLDFNQNLYDQTIKIAFFKFIREPIKFDNIENLKKAIAEDVRFTINWFKK